MTTYKIGNIGQYVKVASQDEFWSRFPSPPAPHSLLVRWSGVVEERYEFRTDEIASPDTYAYLPGGHQNYVIDDQWLHDVLLEAGYTLEPV